MAEGGAHSASCETANPGSICDCDCAGAQHATAGGRAPSASGVTDRARARAAAEGREVVTGDRDGRTRSVERRPRIPSGVLAQIRAVRAAMPATQAGWDAASQGMERNENGRMMPSPEHERHLNNLLGVGRAALGAARSEFDRDPEIQAARQRIAAADAVNAYWRAEHAEIIKRRPFGRSAAVMRAEAAEFDRINAEAARRRALAGLGEGYYPGDDRRLIARRESAILHEMLSTSRPMGGGQHTWLIRLPNLRTAEYRGARKDAEERLKAAERYFPDDWVARSADYPLRLESADRAYYLNQGGGQGGVLAMPATSKDKAAYDGAFPDRTDEVTVHELGHRMETMVPGLTAMEFTMVRRRSTNSYGESEEPQKLADLIHSGYAPGEVAFKDEWAHPYAGKTYEAPGSSIPDRGAWELFQVGLQETYGRGGTRYDTGDDLQAFTLGALLTLGRPA